MTQRIKAKKTIHVPQYKYPILPIKYFGLHFCKKWMEMVIISIFPFISSTSTECNVESDLSRVDVSHPLSEL